MTGTESDKYYNEGYDASKEGKEFWENPYSNNGMEKFALWNDGWRDYSDFINGTS